MKFAAFESYPDYGIFNIVCSAVLGDNAAPYEFTDADNGQGFSYYDGAVTMFTLNRSMIDIEVMLSESVELRHDTVRAIQIPFRVEGDLGITMGGMHEEIDVGIPDGHYALVFEQGYQGNPQKFEERYDARLWGRISFKPETNAAAKILIKDDELQPPATLFLRNAEDENTVGLGRGDYADRIRTLDVFSSTFESTETPTAKHDCCQCTGDKPLVLEYRSVPSSLFCIECRKETDPERLRPVLNNSIIHAINEWHHLFVAFSVLNHLYNFSDNQNIDRYKTLGHQELENIDSEVNRQGLAVRKSLEDNGRTCYYWYAQGNEDYYNHPPITQCPQCQQTFSRYNGEAFPYLVCETCKIITYAGYA